MRYQILKGLALAVRAFLLTIAISASANAGSLRQGSGSGGAVTGSLPGEVLWTAYRVGEQVTPFDGGSVSITLTDNIIRLINPNGGANGNLAGAKTQKVCTMIYVFDDDEEMGECCGCPLTSAQLATFSVEHNLTSDWALTNGPEGGDHANGSIAIVAAAPNTIGCHGGGAACNGGCDPTNTPGYSVTTANNLLGSITHGGADFVNSNPPVASAFLGLTEVALSDDAGGDPTNLTYLQQNQSGALVGNGTGGGICNCPTE